MRERCMWLLCVILLFLFVKPSFQAKKKIDRSSIIEINDIKPFKKLQRTHTNLLVLFAQNERDASGRFDILAKVAEEVRGKGTIAYINCGENKKLCKKLKVSPQPLVLKHYKDGTFNKDYDRKNTVKSMLNFFNDPTGEMPWEEEEGTENVQHIKTQQDFKKLIKKEKKPVMVMFYAPWCGYCKKLKPVFALAATDLKGEAVMAGMDVDTYEGYPIRQEFNITGFPTLIYFENGKHKYRYQGKNDRDSLVEWMRNPVSPSAAPKEEEWSDTPSDVVHLKDDTFEDFIANNPSVLVMFYAPWCGHCKAMKPEYVEAAKTLKEEEVSGVLAAVDATKERNVGKRFKIEGYPTVKYFKDGAYAFEVNERTSDKIVDFMKDPKEPPAPPPSEASWSDVQSEVRHLTDDTFKIFLKKKKHALVMFYAPWCGHCKKAKPEFMDAAKHDADNTKVVYAAIDCTVHTAVCGQYDVHGYPTFRYFNYGKKDFKYTGGREAKDFIKFMEDPREGPPPPPPEPEWKDVPSHVNHLTDDTFDDFIRTHYSVLVMFYAPWCGHCKAMKPDYMDAAEQLHANNARSALAAVDCTKEKSVATKFDIDGYPTIKYFRNGKFSSEYKKARKTADLVDFVLNSEDTEPAGAKAEKRERPVEPSWSDEDNDVVHLTKSTFTRFIQTSSSVLVMFYAPWCPHCKKIKPEFSRVAREVNTENKIDGALGAVDCTVEADLCSELEIKGYPTLKYYKDGEFSFKYTMKRKAEDMLAFMKNPQKPAPPPPPPDWSKEPGDVHFLTNETFETFMSERASVLVMFFAPWCGYCNSMKADFFKAAEILSNEHEGVALAAVDCTRYKEVGKQFGVKGFPSVKYFKNGRFDRDYEGDRSVDDLISFMKTVSGLDEESEEEQEKEEKQAAEPEGLKILTAENFKTFLSETEHVVVMFYAPWCGHCQNAKPKFVKASKAFAEEPDKEFTAVDCTKDADLCDEQNVNGYPTIKYYRRGVFVVEYDGDRIEEDFVAFMKSPPLPPGQFGTGPSDSHQPLPPDQPERDASRDEL